MQAFKSPYRFFMLYRNYQMKLVIIMNFMYLKIR